MVDLRSGLVLDLNMETLEDYSGNSNSGIATGTTLTTDRFNRLNKARSFSSTNLITITSPVFDESTTHSVSMWIYRSSALTQYGNLLAVNDSQYYMEASTGEIKSYNSVNGFTTTGYNVPLSMWTHINFVAESTSLKLYVNGNLQFTDATYSLGAGGSGDLILGNINAGSKPINGIMDDIKIFNRELSATEVSQLYNDVRGNYQGLFSGLVAGYDFNGDSKDCSGNGNDGTVTGATLTSDKFGISNNAYSFNGTTGNYITIGVNNLPINNDDRSFILWVNPDEVAAANKSMLSYGATGTSNGFNIDNNSGYVKIQAYGNSAVASSTTKLTVGIYQMVGVTWDGTNIRYYYNGVLDGTTTMGAVLGTDSGTGRIGGVIAGWPGGAHFQGDIEEVFSFNRTLSSDEVKQLYDLSKKKYIYTYMREANDN